MRGSSAESARNAAERRAPPRAARRAPGAAFLRVHLISAAAVDGNGVRTPARRCGPCTPRPRMDLVAHQPPQAKSRALNRPDLPGLWRAFWKKPSDQRRNRLVEAYQPLVRDVVQRFAQRL